MLCEPRYSRESKSSLLEYLYWYTNVPAWILWSILSDTAWVAPVRIAWTLPKSDVWKVSTWHQQSFPKRLFLHWLNKRVNLTYYWGLYMEKSYRWLYSGLQLPGFSLTQGAQRRGYFLDIGHDYRNIHATRLLCWDVWCSNSSINSPEDLPIVQLPASGPGQVWWPSHPIQPDG